jgi:hypothetical protein
MALNAQPMALHQAEVFHLTMVTVTEEVMTEEVMIFHFLPCLRSLVTGMVFYLN